MLELTTVCPVTVTAETDVKKAVSIEVDPDPFWAAGKVNKLPPNRISKAKPARSMLVVPKSGLFSLGGSTWVAVGDSSRLRGSRMMLSIGLGPRLEVMVRAYQKGCCGGVARQMSAGSLQKVLLSETEGIPYN